MLTLGLSLATIKALSPQLKLTKTINIIVSTREHFSDQASSYSIGVNGDTTTTPIMSLDSARDAGNPRIVRLVRNKASTQQSSQRVISTWCPTLPAHSIPKSCYRCDEARLALVRRPLGVIEYTGKKSCLVWFP
jgi:hypothetical protein